MLKNRTELAATAWPPTFILRPAFNGHGARLHGKFVVTLDGRQLRISRQPIKDTRVRRVEEPPNVFLDQNTKQAVPFAERDEADTLDSDGRAA